MTFFYLSVYRLKCVFAENLRLFCIAYLICAFFSTFCCFFVVVVVVVACFHARNVLSVKAVVHSSQNA